MKKAFVLASKALLLVGFVLLYSSCGKDPEVIERKIDPNFEIGGTWFFQVVSGEGVIQGIETIDDDPNPNGFITFNEDGTGFSDFAINLLNRPYGKQEQIQWERLNETQVLITEMDGDEDLWELVRANDNVIEATWEIFFSEENNAIISATLTPDP